MTVTTEWESNRGIFEISDYVHGNRIALHTTTRNATNELRARVGRGETDVSRGTRGQVQG